MSEHALIAEAFSRTAEHYDRFARDHPHLTRMREKVYRHIMRYFPSGARVLELAAGTGADAVFLAKQGFRVHAIDIAPGMLARLDAKINRQGLGDRITTQLCSVTNLNEIQGGPFDSVFSNMGGLNCLADLRPVIEGLPGLVRPGGVITWVLMPRICLWELALLLTGRPRLALRRLSPDGTLAHLEGLRFKVHYYSPREIVHLFGPDYRQLAIEGLSVITPTAESKNLARRTPRLYAALAWLDDRLSNRPPWWGWGDFFMISLRYEPRR